MGVETVDEATTGSEPEDIEEVLGTDDFVFVDEFNDEIGGLVVGAESLRYEYVVGGVSNPGKSSTGHLHFDLVSEGSSVHCIRFGGRLEAIDGEHRYYHVTDDPVTKLRVLTDGAANVSLS